MAWSGAWIIAITKTLRKASKFFGFAGFKGRLRREFHTPGS
jgi:hypothetical protein